jgi:hypothetical protein
VNASVLSAHTAEEIICVVGVAAPDGPLAVAVALAVVAGALKAEDPCGHPAGERPVPAVVRRFEEHRLPERGSWCTRPGRARCRVSGQRRDFGPGEDHNNEGRRNKK